MRLRTRFLGAAMALTTALTVFQSGAPVVAQPPDKARKAGPAAPAVRTVTLVTGDVVSVFAGEQVTLAGVRPAKGREGMSFAVSQAAGRLRVIPGDAVAGLRDKRLDPRLFDVSTLLEFGYDDRRADLPLMVLGGPAMAASRARPVPGGTAMQVAKGDLAAMWRGPGLRSLSTSRLWLDGLRQPVLDRSVAQIKAPAAWQAGLTGAGVTVAVVDTGVDATHPDLAGQVTAARDFVGDGHDLDLVGHGTHVAATIAGNGGTYRGVAPGARLLSAKVCMVFGCPESSILQGMQWAAEQGAKVVNMSLGGADGPEVDPLEAAVQDLTAQYGTLFVISAGNAGGDESIGSPGSAEAALTVGAVDRNDALATFSSRGPRVGDGALKPDITAPGVGIVAARGKDAQIGEPGAAHMALSGTSMAAPHVAGAAAILAQQHPGWSPEQIKAALMASAQPGAQIPVYGQGAGRVDVARAVTQRVLAQPAGVSFGMQPWPHHDDEVLARTVTYRNTGDTELTLALSLTGVPAGMFALSAGTVTLPAGGSASVTLTADTRVNLPDARYGGHLVATAGQTVVSTPFAVDKEAERYNVTLRPLDRAGQPTQDTTTLLIDPVSGAFFDTFGEATVRVPRGRYLVLSDVFEAQDLTMLAEPDVMVDRDRTVMVDARAGHPLDLTLPTPDDQAQLFVASAVVRMPGGAGAFLAMADPGVTLHTGSVDPARTNSHLTGQVTALYSAEGVEPAVSPYVAELAWRKPGRLFQGLRKHLSWADLATVDTRYAEQGWPLAWVRFGPTWADLPRTANPVNLASEVALPGRRLEYHNTDDGVSWSPEMYEVDFDQPEPLVGNVLIAEPMRLSAGTRLAQTRNLAVYGPGFAAPLEGQGWVTRDGDTMTLAPTIVNDQLNWSSLPVSGQFRTLLQRNGQTVVDEPFPRVRADVAPGDAAYRLTAQMSRGAGNALSTSVTCVWTFRSATTSGPKPLPLSAVRFLPDLDTRNTAPAGRPFVLPFQVQRQAGSGAGRVRSLSIEVSYDDGASWRRVPAARFGDRGWAALTHPAGAGFVSLRAAMTDQSANTASVTVMRAYRFG